MVVYCSNVTLHLLLDWLPGSTWFKPPLEFQKMRDHISWQPLIQEGNGRVKSATPTEYSQSPVAGTQPMPQWLQEVAQPWRESNCCCHCAGRLQPGAGARAAAAASRVATLPVLALGHSAAVAAPMAAMGTTGAATAATWAEAAQTLRTSYKLQETPEECWSWRTQCQPVSRSCVTAVQCAAASSQVAIYQPWTSVRDVTEDYQEMSQCLFNLQAELSLPVETWRKPSSCQPPRKQTQCSSQPPGGKTQERTSRAAT